MISLGETPRIGHNPIKMRLVDRGTDVNHQSPLKQVGDFYWIRHGERYWRDHDSGKYWERVSEDARILVLAMPLDSEQGWTYTEWTINHQNSCDASWSWDGNEESPTLSPSLHAVGSWHGWIRNGHLVEA